MQDRYTGDVGDFGKYGMLRQLCGLRDENAQLKLGVVWYRPNPELIAAESVHDGRHIAYLCPKQENVGEKQKREYRCCDPPLYDKLREIVKRDDRRIKAVEETDLLGPDTVFYGHQIPNPGERARGGDRVRDRRRWTEGALQKTENCDVVFLDPDNGLEPKSVSIARKMAPKYTYLEEVSKWVERRQSVVIYHHLSRGGTHAEQIARWLKRLGQRFEPADIFALHFRRGTSRAFFVLATAEHASVLRKRAQALVASPWSEHFDLHE